MKADRPLSLVLALAVALGAPGPGAYAASASIVKLAGTSGKPVLSLPALSPNVGLLSAIQLQPRLAGPAAPAQGLKAVAPAPIAAKPQLERAALPLDEAKSSSENKAESDRRWDASSVKNSETTGLTLPSGTSATKPVFSKIGRRERDHVIAQLGTVPAPQVAKAKVLAGAYWLTLIGTGVWLNHPFDRVAPMVLAVFLSPAISFFWIIFMGSAKNIKVSGLKTSPEGKDRAILNEFHDRVKSIAASAGVREPDEIKILSYGKEVQAYVDGGSNGYLLGASKALLNQPKDIQEAILRHEFAHVRHNDCYFMMAQALLAPIGPMLALVSNLPDGNPWALGLAATAMLLGLSVFQKYDEYQADQAAAAGMGGPTGLVRYFFKDSKDKRAAISAAGGKIFPELSGWRRALALSWLWIKSSLSSHPPHILRIARLARLARGA